MCYMFSKVTFTFSVFEMFPVFDVKGDVSRS